MELDSSGYQYLLGKTKDEVIRIHGKCSVYDVFNIWTYYLRTDWYGKQIYLFIYFENHIVIGVKVKSLWGYEDLLVF
jgi:hypothetical protein